jgi:hypothetical protein
MYQCLRAAEAQAAPSAAQAAVAPQAVPQEKVLGFLNR